MIRPVQASSARPEWEISGEAATGTDAVEQTQLLRPDIVLLDISMPGMSGLEASPRMRKIGVSCPILVFTTDQSETLGADVRQSGAQRLVAKSQAFRDLVRAIDTLVSGGTFFGGPAEQTPKAQGSHSGLTRQLMQNLPDSCCVCLMLCCSHSITSELVAVPADSALCRRRTPEFGVVGFQMR